MKSNQEQAKEFRKLYRLKSSESKPTRQYQCDLITEEYQEFIEAEGMLFRGTDKYKEECLKRVSRPCVCLLSVCCQHGLDLDRALKLIHDSNLSN